MKRKGKTTGNTAQQPTVKVTEAASPKSDNKQKSDSASKALPKSSNGLQMNTLLEETKVTVNRIYREVVGGVNDRFHFKSCPSTGEIMSSPMVVFLGNHSSGKSTFINYLLGERDLQTTGTAPMDDGFTLISYGSHRDEQQGPAIVNNTKLPFASLSNIGGQFVEHLKMKYLPHPLLKDVTLVDSPGMIDSVSDEGRGYDFLEAVRWFAERADYVLFFFDGEKPGTTGETLTVFTEALSGIDHKLLIIMNKVDAFKHISDFVRTFGTLCWNLAKVIPFKDMPFIYTTYLPQAELRAISPSTAAAAAPAESLSPSSASHRSGWSLDEFDKARETVTRKVQSAPSRHADNMLIQLKKHTEDLLMHAKVISEARSRLWFYRLQAWLAVLLLVVVGSVLAVKFTVAGDGGGRSRGLVEGLNDTNFILTMILLLAGALVALVVIIPRLVRRKETTIASRLHEIYEHVYASELMGANKDYYGRQWEVLQPVTKYAVDKFGLLSFPSLQRKQAKRLSDVVEVEVEDMLNRVHENLKAE